MIYTFTANLAIDLFVETNDLFPNTVNRTNYFDCTANGKGVNVSLILDKLGLETTVTGFQGGFTGKYIEEYLESVNIPTSLPEIDGLTRINVFTKVLNEKKEYAQVNPGPAIDENAKSELLKYYKDNLRHDDIVTINGSFPEGIDKEYIVKLCKLANEKNAEIVIDNSSNFVPELCAFNPLFIKPNEDELCAWFNEEVQGEEQFIRLSKKLLEMGAKNILLSLGKEGAMLINKNIVMKTNAPKGTVVNTAMSGDTLLATFLAEKVLGKTNSEALMKAVCAGSSTAFREGLTDFSDVEELMKEVKITILQGGSDDL